MISIFMPCLLIVSLTCWFLRELLSGYSCLGRQHLRNPSRSDLLCRFIVACQQFRCRDLVDCDIMLHCHTQPIIESSIGLGFCCWNVGYTELAAQMTFAKLEGFHNCWSHIHNFTPKMGACWQYVDEQGFDLKKGQFLKHTLPQDVAVSPHCPCINASP
jgi:hypothetical protein